MRGKACAVTVEAVLLNNRRRAFEVRIQTGWLTFPYSKAEPAPTRTDPAMEAHVDEELGSEGFTYTLASGTEGSVHVEQVLEYNRDPRYIRDLLLYRLTLEAQELVDRSPLSKREIIRRLGSSPAQLYRLLDATNYRKSVDGLLTLFAALDCEVDLAVRPLEARIRE